MATRYSNTTYGVSQPVRTGYTTTTGYTPTTTSYAQENVVRSGAPTRYGTTTTATYSQESVVRSGAPTRVGTTNYTTTSYTQDNVVRSAAPTRVGGGFSANPNYDQMRLVRNDQNAKVYQHTCVVREYTSLKEGTIPRYNQAEYNTVVSRVFNPDVDQVNLSNSKVKVVRDGRETNVDCYHLG